jgi:hypothetical protein
MNDLEKLAGTTMIDRGATKQVSCIRPEARILAEKIDNGLKQIKARTMRTENADPGWAMYNQAEQERRLDEQKKSADATSQRELSAFEKDISDEVKKYRAEIFERAYPLQASLISDKNRRGEYLEQKAERAVKSSSIEQIDGEFITAMAEENYDYASGLLYWIDRSYEDFDHRDHEKVGVMRRAYNDELGIQTYENSIEYIEGKLKLISDTRKLFASGYRGTTSTAKTFLEWEKMVQSLDVEQPFREEIPGPNQRALTGGR